MPTTTLNLITPQGTVTLRCEGRLSLDQYTQIHETAYAATKSELKRRLAELSQLWGLQFTLSGPANKD